MSIPKLSVDNPVAANLIMVLLLAAGLYFALTMPREFFPQVEISIVTVNVVYPGSTPAEVEKGMVIKIEEAIHDLEDIDEITSTINEGMATVMVRFKTRKNIDQAVNDIKAEMDRLTNLPVEAEKIEVRKIAFILPVISVMVYGDTTERNLKATAERLRDQLLEETIVTRAQISGLRDPEIAIEVDPVQLEKYNLTFQQVASQIGNDNIDIPGGALKSPHGEIRLRTLGERRDTHSLEEIILVADREGRTVRLRDVATVTDGFKDTVLRGRHNGLPSANITIFKTKEQDAIEIAAVVEEFIENKKADFSGEVQLATRDNLAKYIQNRLGLVMRNGRWGLLLVLLSLTLFLHMRVAFWTALGIPVAILGTFILMKLVGYTTNLVTLFGLIVIMGMVVDDAIVLGENIYRKFQEGLSARDAAIEGATEVAIPVFATVLTTIAAFAPLAFLEGEVGEMFRPMAGVVIAALLVSLIEAFAILPSHLYESLKGAEKRRDAAKALEIQGIEAPPKRGWARFTAATEHFLDVRLRNAYVRLLKKVIHWRYVSFAASLTFLGIIVSLLLSDRPPTVLMQDLDSDMVTASIEMVAGTPVEKTIEALSEIEQACLALPEITSVYTLVGQQIQMTPMAGSMGPRTNVDPATVGQILIELAPAEDRERHSEAILADLRSSVRRIAGVASLKFDGMTGEPTGADFVVRVRGEDLPTLNRAVEYVKDQLALYEGVVDIRSNISAGKLEARVGLNPIGRVSGLTVRDLAMQMRSAVFGAEAQTLQRGRDEVKVQVRLAKDWRDSIGDLEQFRIATSEGGRIPFQEVGSLHTARGYGTLSRIDRKRAVTIEADLDENRTVSPAHRIAADLEAGLSDIGVLFPGVTLAFGGEREEIIKSVKSIIKGFIFAIAVIYAILALVFQSYVQPLIIMLAVPFGLIGAVVGHLVMGYPFTMMSWIGLSTLTGVVVNDSLILVDFINRGRQRGLSAYDAVILGGRTRLRPIILTSVTTIFGLVPLMAEQSFEAQILIPMAISISFGLAFATVLTLLILPCLYCILDDAHVMLGNLWNGRPLLTPEAPNTPTED